jgi:hypothetical protein
MQVVNKTYSKLIINSGLSGFSMDERRRPFAPNRPSHLSVQKSTTAGRMTPPGGKLSRTISCLEGVPSADLHHSGLTLDLREV